MQNIIVVVGPTGVGKTKMGVALANIYNGEVISADSMQVYKELNVGTAKVTKEEMSSVKHHLLDIKEVTDDYSVYDYQKDAREKISEIASKGKIPIIVGGTGYYIKALLYDYRFSEEEEKDKTFDELSNEEIISRIQEFDSDIVIDKDNRKRLVRALNKIEKESYIYQQDMPLIYDNVIFIGLTTDIDTLYEKINKRVDNMIINLIDEVKSLYKRNIRSKSIMTGIGYKELYDFFDDKISFKESIDLIKKNSRNYAKRQYTFFNNKMNINWFDVDYDDFSKTILEVCAFIEGE